MTSMPPPRPAGDRLTGLDNQRHRALLEILVVLPIVPGHRLLISPTANVSTLRGEAQVLHLLGRLGVHGVGYAWFVSRRGRWGSQLRDRSITGTGDDRTILAACDPRNSRPSGPLLIPTASRSPSFQLTSWSAADQELP